MSCFFNPTGSDLVILAEDAGRALHLDEIEAQYFLAAAGDGRLHEHLRGGRVDFIRYANACQDLSRPLPPWQVHTLSGIAGGQLLASLANPIALSRVWRLDPPSGEIKSVHLDLSSVWRHTIGEWRVTFSQAVLDEMRERRRLALPNETGGILIGSFDLSRRVAHVVAALKAPEDSAQAPTYFIRGAKDLKPVVDDFVTASAGALCYIGEWHSHPDGAAARPSSDDEHVYAHLNRHLGPTGAPFLMAIAGTDEVWFRFGAEGRTLGETSTLVRR